MILFFLNMNSRFIKIITLLEIKEYKKRINNRLAFIVTTTRTVKARS